MKNLNLINFKPKPIYLVRKWLQSLEINNYKIAKLFCTIIPAHCPFQREIKIFNHILLRIPPLCKLNPFYEELIALRFKSLSYLANQPSNNLKLS